MNNIAKVLMPLGIEDALVKNLRGERDFYKYECERLERENKQLKRHFLATEHPPKKQVQADARPDKEDTEAGFVIITSRHTPKKVRDTKYFFAAQGRL